MSKYIDAEKLKYEIERFKATEYGDNTFGDDVANGALDYVLEEIIPSLQQEQPEVDLEDEIRRESCISYLANTRDVIEFSQYIGNNAKESGKKEIQKDIDWLKSLRPSKD